jgi:hypothetical protein
LPRPVIESHQLGMHEFATRLPFQFNQQRHSRLMISVCHIESPTSRSACLGAKQQRLGAGTRRTVGRSRSRYDEASRRN